MAGTAKAYCLAPEQVLYDMSLANVTMYSAVLPTYRPKKRGKGGKDRGEVIKADDPRNSERVRRMLESFR